MRTYFINQNKRKQLRENSIQGAIQYSKYFVDKDFLIICEDGTEYIVHFLKSNFKHLTGINSNLSDNDFFSNCINKTLDVGNINEYQKYNWDTLKSKSNRICQIHRILYDNIQNTLFLINLHTNTRKYPIAIKNTNINTCIGFVDNDNKARTLRKYSNSNNADEQKRIYLILAKKKNTHFYDELIYISKIENIYNVNESIMGKISENLYDKFLEILTRPDLQSEL